MKKIERRIKEYIKEHEGVTSSQMGEYFNKDPKAMKRILDYMKEKGAIVGKNKTDY